MAESYKQQVAQLYSRRSESYGIDDWHRPMARKLVDCAGLQPGWRVLDVATGTGLAAFAAAERVGAGGSVLGVDISEGMLAVARRQIPQPGSAPCQFELMDIEIAVFADAAFDAVLCSSAIVWLADIPAALRRWHRWLAPGGVLAFHAFSERSFVTGWVLQQLAVRHGVPLKGFHALTGSPERCIALVEAAGFEDAVVTIEDRSSYLSLAEAQNQYGRILTGPFPQAPVAGSPFDSLNPAERAALQADYEAELTALAGDRGVWNENVTYYVVCRRPPVS
ncbi:class I SAM-dependent methyltransferase [Gloeobacter kilaueensis]|uniref:Ubiquinone/menaquinone biosynthesis methyltransferase n=1 Tax=Gloeobacter kilaueensis (strain ATCC BAA-2537 / CCAP 1431/1 / ULC 316 / JS1) TaxID=1183438 RepID=U5QSG5_GLOK1|nr:methyltransferase domain-containing protein [Gloeobacter kilaueensis]AGY60614.1 ubiquinone/menaquinone biosynthesis methyltransferase [Gloeobacter kilaueensis JS1]